MFPGRPSVRPSVVPAFILISTFTLDRGRVMVSH